MRDDLALSTKHETHSCRLMRHRQRSPRICYAAFSWYILFNANTDATFRREEERDDTEKTCCRETSPSSPTNLHLARRQMSLCNQNYLSIQEPLSRFCVFRPPSAFPSPPLGLLSFFIQILSCGIIKHETLVYRKREWERIASIPNIPAEGWFKIDAAGSQRWFR